ncbi:hypothetical protein V6N13_053414 [Hibiscus sabdariffa]
MGLNPSASSSPISQTSRWIGSSLRYVTPWLTSQALTVRISRLITGAASPEWVDLRGREWSETVHASPTKW